jgi:hypothetical protein
LHRWWWIDSKLLEREAGVSGACCGAYSEAKKKTFFFFFPFHHFFSVDFVMAGLFKIINDICVFSGPLFLTLILFFLGENNEWPLWLGVLLAFAMFLGAVIQTLAVNAYFVRLGRVGVQSKAVLTTLILEHMFVSRSPSLGSITTLVSVDASRMYNAVVFIHLLWSAPLQIVAAVYLLYNQMGVSSLAGLGVIVGFLPVNYLIVNRLAKIQGLSFFVVLFCFV